MLVWPARLSPAVERVQMPDSQGAVKINRTIKLHSSEEREREREPPLASPERATRKKRLLVVLLIV